VLNQGSNVHNLTEKIEKIELIMKKMDKDHEDVFLVNKDKIEVYREFEERTRFIAFPVNQFTQTTSFYADNVF
jgi:hypothetical protein